MPGNSDPPWSRDGSFRSVCNPRDERLRGSCARWVRTPTISQARQFHAPHARGNVTVFLIFLINAIFRGSGRSFRSFRCGSLWLANGLNMRPWPLLHFWPRTLPPEWVSPGLPVATNLGRGIRGPLPTLAPGRRSKPDQGQNPKSAAGLSGHGRDHSAPHVERNCAVFDQHDELGRAFSKSWPSSEASAGGP